MLGSPPRTREASTAEWEQWEMAAEPETEALLGESEGATGRPGAAGGDGARRRGVPQGRAVAQAILDLMADSEHITKVPGVRADTQEGSAEWQRVERFHEERFKNKQKAFVKGKVEAVFWLLAGYATLTGTNFIEVIFTDTRIRRGFLNAGLVGVAIILLVMLYLIFWLSLVHDVDWERLYSAPEGDAVSQRSPHRSNVRNAIGLAAICFALNMFCFPIACWPVWQFWYVSVHGAQRARAPSRASPSPRASRRVCHARQRRPGAGACVLTFFPECMRAGPSPSFGY